MEFNIAEKLAIVKSIDKVILADRIVANGELDYLGQLMRILDFDSDFVEEARKFNFKQSNSILKGMSDVKKKSLALMLHEMAYADGELNKEEMVVLLKVFNDVGIKLAKENESIAFPDISDVYFKSCKNQRFSNGEKLEDPGENSKKAIKIEPNIEGKPGYSITIFCLDGFLPFWGNKVEVPPIPMEIANVEIHKTIMKGYGKKLEDKTSEDYTNYGLSIYHPNKKIEKIVLHDYHLKMDIEYLE